MDIFKLRFHWGESPRKSSGERPFFDWIVETEKTSRCRGIGKNRSLRFLFAEFLRSPIPSIGALQLMRGRTVHPRIPEIPPAYVQRSLLLLTRASYPRAYIISTLTSTECSAIKFDRVLLNRGQSWNEHDCFAQSSGTERSHWPETAVFIAGDPVFPALSFPELYGVYRRNPG